MFGQAHGHERSHNDGIPEDGAATLHHTYGTEHAEICLRQRAESVCHGLENHLPCRKRGKGVGKGDGKMDASWKRELILTFSRMVAKSLGILP